MVTCLPVFRIRAQIAQRRLGRATSTTASVLRLREQFFGLLDIDGEDLVFGSQRTRVGLAVGTGLGQVGAVTAIVG